MLNVFIFLQLIKIVIAEEKRTKCTTIILNVVPAMWYIRYLTMKGKLSIAIFDPTLHADIHNNFQSILLAISACLKKFILNTLVRLGQFAYNHPDPDEGQLKSYKIKNASHETQRESDKLLLKSQRTVRVILK